MMNLLWGVLGFIITIGILVVIHEYGHFWVARFFDVKILRFSLGFGKPIVSWTGKKDGTLYTIAPIPLGGFVAMYGESDEEDIPEGERHRTFAAKPAWQRFLIAFAGPAVNLLFAILAFSVLFMSGVEGIKPVISYVAPQSIAADAGLSAGDQIVSINGRDVKLGVDAHTLLFDGVGRSVRVGYLPARKDEAVHFVSLDLSSMRAGDELNLAQYAGLYLADEWQPASIEKVIDASPAAAMGLQDGDQIISINQEHNIDLFSANRWIGRHPDAKVNLVVNRAGQQITLHGRLGERDVQGKTLGYLGIHWQAPDFSHLVTTERYGVWTALEKGAAKTWFYTRMTYAMFERLLRHEISIKNMGGPLTIGDAAGKAIRYGWSVFLNFLGVVSLSLAAINLLPIPGLDGGHMLLSLIEMVRRKPLSRRTGEWVMKIGLSLVLTFMAFVLVVDVTRYLF